MNVHKVLGDWSEGLSFAGNPGGQGTDPETGDATWIHRSYPSTFWSNSGGDFSPALSASTTISSASMHQISTQAMRADVQSWVDNPTQSFGWMFKMEAEGDNTAIRVASSESTNSFFRPTLTIEFNTFDFFCNPADLNSTGMPTLLIGGFGSGSGSDLHLEAFDGPTHPIRLLPCRNRLRRTRYPFGIWPSLPCRQRSKRHWALQCGR